MEDKRLIAIYYDRYHNGVKRHIEGREGTILLLNLCAGEGFEKLCPFLGKSVPDERAGKRAGRACRTNVPVESFPHSKKNSRSLVNKPIHRLKRFLVKLFRAGQIKCAILNVLGR